MGARYRIGGLPAAVEDLFAWKGDHARLCAGSGVGGEDLDLDAGACLAADEGGGAAEFDGLGADPLTIAVGDRGDEVPLLESA